MKPKTEAVLFASPMQTSMLMASQSGANGSSYIQQLQWSIKGCLDHNSFQTAWEKTLRRHDVFFFIFGPTKTGLHGIQKADIIQATYQFEDWTDNTIDKIRKQLRTRLTEDFQKGFPFEGEALCRCLLIQTGANSHEFIWTSHHALFDGRSRLQIIQEFLELYQVTNSKKKITESPTYCYESYLRWIESKTWEESKHFWKAYLKDLTKPTPLEFGYENKPRTLNRGRTVLEKRLTQRFSDRLHEWSSDQNYSLNTLILAGWSIFLSKTSGKQHIMFGAPRACRKSNVTDADKTVGLFVNTVPVVVTIKDSGTSDELIAAIRRTWDSIRNHENTLIFLIKQCSSLPPNEPFFSSFVGYEKYQLSQLISPTDGTTHRFRLKGHTDIPFLIQLKDGKRISFEVEYDTSRFTANSAKKVIQSIEVILDQLISQPTGKLADIALVCPEEFSTIRKLGTGKRPHIDRIPVHRLFESVCDANPTNTAIRFNGHYISYQELNQTANRLARYLQKRGVEAGMVVALFLEKGPLAIISQLAILKAGAIYMPLDTEYPKERLQWMIKDSKPKLVLSTSDLKETVEGTLSNPVFIDESKTEWKKFSPQNLKNKGEWDGPAYIMYTSGSTGRPKGVLVPHRGIIRLVQKPNYVRLSSKTRSLQLAPISFDASTFEIWAPFLNGGTCIIYPERVPNIAKLERVLRTESVNLLWLTAALFNFVIDTEPMILKGVRQLLAGGEVLSPSHIRKAQQLLTETTLINGYGPTENTTFSCCFRIPNPMSKSTSIPIGPPINHSSAYVLDRNRNLLPYGVSGELYVGGDGLALGYLNSPGLTKERFVRDPFSNDKRIRLYRTGDRVYLSENGNVEFLDRFDNQVKIRGYRIEPREVLDQLLKRKGVLEASVLVRKDKRSEHELIAFIVGEATTKADTPIRKELALKLPAYMIPSGFVFVDKLPLTVHGKIDQHRLLAIYENETVSNKATTRTQTINSTELSIKKIWEDIFESEITSIDFDFFEIGGNSLLATRFVYELQKAFKVQATTKHLNKHRTIRSIAQWLERKTGTETSEQFVLLKIKKSKPKPLRPLANAWRSVYFSNIESPKSTTTNHIVRAIRIKGALKTNLLVKALDYVFNLHERFRTYAVKIGDEYFEKTLPYIKIQPTRKNLSHLSKRAAQKEVQRDFETFCRENVSMREAPMLKSVITHLNSDTHVLTIAINHSISDGHSLGLLLLQTSQVYNDLVNGNPITVKASHHSFRDYEQSLTTWLDRGHKKRIINYWKQKSLGLQEINLPFQKKILPRSAKWNVFSHYELNSVWTPRFRNFIQTHGISAYQLIATVGKWTVARHTKDLDSYYAVSSNIRSGPEEDSIAGELATVMLVRNQIHNNWTFNQQAESDREALMEALDHRFISISTVLAPLIENGSYAHQLGGQFRISYAPALESKLDFEGLDTSTKLRHRVAAIMKLGIVVRETDNRIILSFQHSPELFLTHGIEHFKFNFQTVLKQVLENPAITFEELPDFSRRETFAKPLPLSAKRNSILNPIQQIEGKQNRYKLHGKSLKRREIEALLAKIWQEMLNSKSPRTDEDFFESGGNSLIAASFLHRVEKQFQVQLSFSEFRRHSSFTKLVERILQDSHKQDLLKPFVIQRAPTGPIADLDFKWEKFFIGHIKNPENARSLLVCRALFLEGPLRPSILKRAIQAVISNQEELRTYAWKNADRYFKRITKNVDWELPTVDLSELSPVQAFSKAESIFEKECTQSVNMRRCTLFRFKLIKVGKNKHLLSLVFHHAITDGVSIEIFYKQTCAAYKSLIKKQQPKLKRPKTTARQQEVSLTKWLKQGNAERIYKVWEKSLRSAPLIDYPFLKKRLPASVDWNQYDHYEFPSEWVELIKAFTCKHAISNFSFFSTLIKILVARYTGEMDNYISTAVDSRSSEDETETFGCLGNASFIRNKVRKTKPFLSQVAEFNEALYRIMDLKLLSVRGTESVLKNKKHAIHKPIGQLQVIYRVEDDESFNLPGVSVTPVARRRQIATTRLGFVFRETNDRIQLSFQYTPSLYVASGIDRFKYNFQEFLAEVLKRPNIRFNEFPDLRRPQKFRKPLTRSEKSRTFLIPVGGSVSVTE